MLAGPPSEIVLFFLFGRDAVAATSTFEGPDDARRCAALRPRERLTRRLSVSGRGGRPRPARALTSPIRSVPKWKTVAASTASAPASTAGAKCSAAPGAARGDHRDRHLAAYGADQLEVEAVLGAVGVHRVEQDLPGAELGAARGPLDRVEPGGLAAAVGGDLEAGVGAVGPAGVDRQHQHLVAEPVGDLGDQLGPVDRGGVDRDLVGAGAQQPVDVLDASTLPRRRSAG